MDAWLERLRKEITETTTDLDDSDWNRAPSGRWTSAQIVEHLGRSYGTTAKMLELMLKESGSPQVRAANLKEFLLRLLIVDLGVFPSGAKAPAIVVPQGDLGPAALTRALLNLERMDAGIKAAEERWGEGPVAIHMILGPLNAKQWRKFHYVHGHHHVRQMKKRIGKSE
jgi:hypothetical protein